MFRFIGFVCARRWTATNGRHNMDYCYPQGVSPREASEDRQCTRGYLGGAGMPHADNVALSTLTVQQDDVQTAPAKKKV